MFFPFIFEKSPFLMKTPSQNFAHHTEVKKHPFGVKTPNLATLIGTNSWGPNIGTNSQGPNVGTNSQGANIEGHGSVHPDKLYQWLLKRFE